MDDHPALAAASKAKASVIAFTIRNEQLEWDIKSNRTLCGPFRKRFQDQAIQAMDTQLQKIGIPLLIIDQPQSGSAVLEQMKQQGVDTIYASFEHEVKYDWLREAANETITVQWFAGNHLFADWPIEQDQFPKVFTDFKKKLQRTPDSALNEWHSESTAIKSISSDAYDPRSAVPFDGSESTALQRLHHYFIQTDGLSQYKKTRNGLIGTEYSSKLSLFLSVGSLSVRRIWSMIDRHESQFGKNDGSEWMRYELLWREFFYWQSLKYPDQFFTASGIQNKNQNCTPNLAKLESWIQGQTGDTLVDACMNELRMTGYLSNRGRQNAASYLVHTLQLPWLWGARYFEWILIDFDRTQNYGNWAYLAGVGSDPRSFGNQGPRFFNTEKQARDYDSNSSYRHLWKSTN